MSDALEGYKDFILELLEALGGVSARKMFGGYGLFREGRMFALIADEELYLKVDEINRPDYDAAGLPPFTYVKNGKPMQMSYYQAPPEALDDPSIMVAWASAACAAARRAKP